MDEPLIFVASIVLVPMDLLQGFNGTVDVVYCWSGEEMQLSRKADISEESDDAHALGIGHGEGFVILGPILS